MKKEGLIFNSQAKADISDMGRIEELRCFSRFVEVKAANISSLFLLVSSNVFFYWENFVQQVKDTFVMHLLKNFTAKNFDIYFWIEIKIGIGSF